MHVKKNCKNFSWEYNLLVSENKINQNKLKLPNCKINKLNKFLSCPDNCKWFEKI